MCLVPETKRHRFAPCDEEGRMEEVGSSDFLMDSEELEGTASVLMLRRMPGSLRTMGSESSTIGFGCKTPFLSSFPRSLSPLGEWDFELATQLSGCSTP